MYWAKYRGWRLSVKRLLRGLWLIPKKQNLVKKEQSGEAQVAFVVHAGDHLLTQALRLHAATLKFGVERPPCEKVTFDGPIAIEEE